MKIHYDEERKSYYVVFRYTNYAGKSVPTTRRGFATKREAKAAALEVILKAEGKPTITVQQLVDEMMESLKKRLRPNSIRQKDMLYRLYICNKLGDTPVANITPRTIIKWQDDLPKDKSPSTIAAANGAFSALLNYACKFYHLESNPFTVTGKTGRYEKREEFWEDSQYQKFISIVADPMWHAVFNLVYYCGLRRGECPPLEYKDIDFEMGTIYIHKAIDDEGRLGPPKHGSIRTISVPQFLLDEIKAYRANFYEPPNKIFDMSYATIKDNFNKYRDKSGLPHITLHGLRHSHASYLIQQGVPISVISKRLGHKDAAITLRVYSHVYKHGDNNVAKMLDESQSCRQNVVTEKDNPPQSP